MDLALKSRKPFFVVPCCVFPTLFPHRVLADGRQVRSYEQFIEYLAAKDESIQRHVLTGLATCNIVLYKVSYA